jgi:hypothetical protein
VPIVAVLPYARVGVGVAVSFHLTTSVLSSSAVPSVVTGWNSETDYFSNDFSHFLITARKAFSLDFTSFEL